MLRILVVALCLACASAFNVVGAAALRSAQPTLAVSMKAAAAPKSEKELRAEAIAKARAELAAAEAERAAALAEKEAALAALKKKGSAPARKAPEFKAPSFSVPSISLPKFSMPSGGSSTPGANAAVDLSNPAVKALVAGAAVGLAPAGAIISLRSFLDVSSTLEKSASTCRGTTASAISLLDARRLSRRMRTTRIDSDFACCRRRAVAAREGRYEPLRRRVEC